MQSRHHSKLKLQSKAGEEFSDKVSTCNKDKSASDENAVKSTSQRSGEDNKKTLFLAACDTPGVESVVSKATTTSGSSIPDTDIWSETSDAGVSDGKFYLIYRRPILTISLNQGVLEFFCEGYGGVSLKNLNQT